MDKIEFLSDVAVTFSIMDFAVDFLLCMVASFMLRKVYILRSISLSGKFHIGTVIPILALVTFLVIMVVKSSLALSLGLVGALSVVRFRTPIKEPEELVYLFLSIALGLGYGAHQTILTSVCFVSILGVIYVWLSRTPKNKRDEYNLLINWEDQKITVKNLVSSVVDGGSEADLLKYSSDGTGESLYVKVNLSDIDDLDAMRNRVRSLDKTATFSFYESRPLQ